MKDYVIVSRAVDDVDGSTTRYYIRLGHLGHMFGGSLMWDSAKRFTKEEAEELLPAIAANHVPGRELVVKHHRFA